MPPDSDPVSIDLETLWNRNFNLLRDCRNLQRRIAELGLRYPIVDLLHALGHIPRELAQEAAGDTHVFPTYLPFKQREDLVLTRACGLRKLNTSQIVAAQQILRAVTKLGAPVSLSYVLVELNYIRWKDLRIIDQQLQDGAGVVPTLDERGTASGPLPAVKRDQPKSFDLENCETSYVPAVGRPEKSRAPSSGVLRRMAIPEPSTPEEQDEQRRRVRERLRAIPEADLVALLRQTRLISEHDIESGVSARADLVRALRDAVSLGEVLMDREVLSAPMAEVILKTYERAGVPREEDES